MKASYIAISNLRILGLVTLVAALPVAVSPVMAGDGKAYSGSECRVLHPSDDADKVEVNDRGAIENLSRTDTVMVACPAVRDTAADFTAKVHVVDYNNASDVFCRLRSISRAGDRLGQSYRRTSGSSYKVQTLDFSSRVKGAGGASIYLECGIPRRVYDFTSEIVSYEIMEL
jgi:hypothetical protein